ncbi:ribosome assembly cofactor RimP [Flavobacteriaceae bacterium]|jgi:ribosome maturation factor RimP|nr:ribosome assembly cofactor RimP [Flavobacteriaceae bacterium]MDC0872593.1 ribosome assembly cofactor RimP [Flavobacteriaceae bacterium]
MNLRSKVESLLTEALDQHPALFLIELKVGADNSIRVILDGDQGVSLKDCMTISRAIEHQLDREAEDFSLEVASVGVGTPLQSQRQYIKNIGRKLKVELVERPSVEGTLIAADDKGFTLKWKQREPKPVGKGKVTVEKQETLSYEQIESAKVTI